MLDKVDVTVLMLIYSFTLMLFAFTFDNSFERIVVATLGGLVAYHAWIRHAGGWTKKQ